MESFVFNEEHQNWSLVNGGPRSPTAEKSSDKQVGESSHGMETAIIVFPSRFNVLAVSEDENEDETEIEKGEVLVEEVMEATLPRESKKSGKQTGVASKATKRKIANSRDLKLMKVQNNNKKTFVRKL